MVTVLDSSGKGLVLGEVDRQLLIGVLCSKRDSLLVERDGLVSKRNALDHAIGKLDDQFSQYQSLIRVFSNG